VERQVTPIDGKSLRGSASEGRKALHVVSVWASENQITLAEIAVDEKSNEITAVPAVLDMIDITGDIVTADAMHCQRETAAKIVEKGADYVLTLKGNQGNLHEWAKVYFDDFADDCATKTTQETGHGRIEKRTYYIETDIEWLEQKDEWANLRAMGMVETEVVRRGKVSNETRYFVTSLTDIDEFAHAVRRHWSIENQYHWRLDVIFREDASKVKKDNAPLNLHILRSKALSLLKNANLSGKLSMSKKMFAASLDTDVLEIILFDSNRAKY
jgi:predicted transposase YbfD/YdcC